MKKTYEELGEEAEKLRQKAWEYYFDDPVKYQYYNGKYIAMLNRQLKAAIKEGAEEFEIEYIKESIANAKEDQMSISEMAQTKYYKAKERQEEIRNGEYYAPFKQLGADFMALLTSIGYNLTASKEMREDAREGLKEELVTAGKNILKTPVVIGTKATSITATVLTLPVVGALDVKSSLDYYCFNKLTYSGWDFEEDLDRVLGKMESKVYGLLEGKKNGRK